MCDFYMASYNQRNYTFMHYESEIASPKYPSQLTVPVL